MFPVSASLQVRAHNLIISDEVLGQEAGQSALMEPGWESKGEEAESTGDSGSDLSVYGVGDRAHPAQAVWHKYN